LLADFEGNKKTGTPAGVTGLCIFTWEMQGTLILSRSRINKITREEIKQA